MNSSMIFSCVYSMLKYESFSHSPLLFSYAFISAYTLSQNDLLNWDAVFPIYKK
jgi:hypothetical protein